MMNRTILTIAVIFLFSCCSYAQTAHPINIGERTFKYKDESRNRPVITEVWYLTNDTLTAKDKGFSPFIRTQTVRNGSVINKKMPLIFISHGTGGGRLTLEWLSAKLVQNGFMVAAVDHYGNTYDNKIAESFVEPWQRPQDISFALTALLKDTLFSTRIDAALIGAAGFSIGGYTVLALAGAKLNLDTLRAYFDTPAGKKEATIPEFPDYQKHLDTDAVTASFKNSPSLRDSRFKAFFAICPAIGQGFTSENQFKDIHNPIYIVGAQSDSICPVKTNAMNYHRLIKGSKFDVVKGKVGHYVFLNEATDQFKKQQPFIFSDDSSVSRHEVHEKVGQLAADFFKGNLK